MRDDDDCSEVENREKGKLERTVGQQIGVQKNVRRPKDERLWTDKYTPYTQDELAVHKNKVDQVRQWCNQALEGQKNKKILLMTGPPGSGKTAVIKMLSLELNFEIIEWSNGQNIQSGSGFGGESASTRFEKFLLQSNKYPSLLFGPYNHSNKLKL